MQCLHRNEAAAMGPQPDPQRGGEPRGRRARTETAPATRGPQTAVGAGKDETKLNKTKRNETKRNETKRNETKRNGTKRKLALGWQILTSPASPKVLFR